MLKSKPKYDLGERTSMFSENIIDFIRSIKRDAINTPLLIQLLRSATSIGANYREANGASSKKDFRNKIHICKKEAKETGYWLRNIAKSNPEHRSKCSELWIESQELTKIFSKIVFTLSKIK